MNARRPGRFSEEIHEMVLFLARQPRRRAPLKNVERVLDESGSLEGHISPRDIVVYAREQGIVHWELATNYVALSDGKQLVAGLLRDAKPTAPLQEAVCLA